MIGVRRLYGSFTFSRPRKTGRSSGRREVHCTSASSGGRPGGVPRLHSWSRGRSGLVYARGLSASRTRSPVTWNT